MKKRELEQRRTREKEVRKSSFSPGYASIVLILTIYLSGFAQGCTGGNIGKEISRDAFAAASLKLQGKILTSVKDHLSASRLSSDRNL